jgi:phosphoribosylamine--glycine ligase
VRVLVVGGGGREHALCWALAKAATVFCAPGNPGTAQVATNLPIASHDQPALLEAVRKHDIELVVVGPEQPLADGLVDRLMLEDIPAFGPTAKAAQIEASKAFAKDVMRKAKVPTAEARAFHDQTRALKYLSDWTVSHPGPVVIKASGIAAGKGVIVCATATEATEAATAMFAGKFGDAGKEIVIEEFMEGEELSVFALTDGERALLLPAAQDHKRLLDDDKGPNTGGMGAYAPVGIATDALLSRVHQDIFLPVLTQMAHDGAPYRGLLYAGLMIDPNGNPRVVEFNCRFGDPETQVVLPVLRAPLLDHMWRIAAGESWNPGEFILRPTSCAVTTVLAASGYPDTPVKGAAITLPTEFDDNQLLFHAGTTLDSAGTHRVAGGRVLCATGLGATVAAAAEASRALAAAITFEGRQYRRDIAWREIARARAS